MFIPFSREMKGVLLFVSLFGSLMGCSQPQEESKATRYRQTKLLLGTVVHVDVCAQAHEMDSVDEVYAHIWKQFQEMHKRMNVFSRENDVGKI